MMEKSCCRCKQILPLASFHKNRCTKDGFTPTCKSCVRKHKASYYARNSEKVKTDAAKWNAANPERKKQLDREYYRSHAKDLVEKTARWRRANPEKARSLSTKWRVENPEKRKLIIANYNEKNAIKMLNQDSYIASKIGLRLSQIPKELLELKRVQLQIHRLIKNQKDDK
jgi:hypothetical protein